MPRAAQTAIWFRRAQWMLEQCSSFAQAEMRAVLSELVKARALRPTRPESEPTLRRAITETPRYDTEVALA
jgi:hypothetical protein